MSKKDKHQQAIENLERRQKDAAKANEEAKALRAARISDKAKRKEKREAKHRVKSEVKPIAIVAEPKTVRAAKKAKPVAAK